MYYSKKIGIFISHIYGDYQQRLCRGMIRKASEHGILAEIFTTNDGEALGDYSVGEQSIMSVPKPTEYAGIIFASGTYRSAALKQLITDSLSTDYSCPVVDVSNDESPFPRIILDNNSPIRELVTHLYKVHGYTHICYLGDSDYPDLNDKRLAAYRNGIQDNGLSVTPCHILTCSSSSRNLADLLPDFLLQNEGVEAIVCYNDALALMLIPLLEQRGLHIPQDIAVTGCDTLEAGQCISPVLTSVTFPVEQLGECAVVRLLSLIHGETQPSADTITASPHIGASCGCPESGTDPASAYTGILQERISSYEYSIIENIHMAAALQDVTEIDQGMELLEKFADRLPFCEELYLCLNDDWNHMPYSSDRLTDNGMLPNNGDTVLLKLSLKNGIRLPECTFTKKDTLPDFVYSASSGSAFIFTPLFFGARAFGYIALSCKDDTIGYSFSFLSWLMNVNSMLKNLCDRENMGLLTERLEDLYMKDTLTGFYNSEGFYLHVPALLNRAIDQQKPLLAAVFDLDCLKTINGTYGYDEENLAVRTLAQALENAADENCIVSRCGQSRFRLVGLDYNQSKAAALIKKMNGYLEHYNRLHTKKFQILMSCGCCIRTLQSPDELSALLEAAGQNIQRIRQPEDK